MRVIKSLEELTDSFSKVAEYLSEDELYRLIFATLLRAGLALEGILENFEDTATKILEPLPPIYRSFASGKQYRVFLRFLNEMGGFLKGSGSSAMEEGDISKIIELLKKQVGKVSGVIVSDCLSLPEFLTLSAKLKTEGFVPCFGERFLVNPLGVTRFVTGQLPYLDAEGFLREYARLLAKGLKAQSWVKESRVDYIVHTQGYTEPENFVKSMPIGEIVTEVRNKLKKGSVLVTSDHGYDLFADVEGLKIAHGAREQGYQIFSFSKVGLFLLIS